MKRFVLPFVLLGILCSTAEAQVKSTPAAPEAVAAPTAASDVAVQSLSSRDARKLGLTLRNTLKIAKELKASGELTGDRSTDAALILQKAVEADPKTFADPTLDWDSILAWIEAILPLIMAIIALF